MAVSSPLNPATIVKEKQPTAAAAQNFITGGSPLGTGVVASAANKIVGFQRGAAAGVAAKPPDLQSIIQTLSSNILTNVENRVQSINQNVTQLVNNNLKGFGDDYKSRLNQIDAARPNSILNNFLSLYREAIGYIQFLGNRKNVKTLGDNLKALQNVFAETFNVAKLVRRTIVKIVKQLSSLPQASTGPGGINLDVSVPGGPLRRSAPTGLLKMMRRRPGLMLGGAALAGGLGASVVSGMMNPGGGDVSAAPTSEGTIPGTLLDKFDSILERFSRAISSLGGGGGGRQTQSSSMPSSGSGADASGDPGSGPSGPGAGATPSAPPGAGAAGPQGAATRALLDTIAFAEGTEGKGDRGYNIQFGGGQFQGYESHPDEVIHGGRYSSAAAGRYQFMPDTWEGLGGKTKRQGGFDFSPENQDKQAVVLTIRRLNAAGIRVNNENELESLLQKEGLSPRIQAALAPEWASFPTAAGVSAYGQPVKKQQKLTEVFQSRLQSQQGAAKVTAPPTVTPDTSQAQMQQQAAQSVAQPPVQQQQSQVTVASPINASSPQTQSSSSPKTIPPPNMQSGGVTVPFFTSSNDDNYLSLYSRLVYNIIDG